jgi:hypothetical protein
MNMGGGGGLVIVDILSFPYMKHCKHNTCSGNVVSCRSVSFSAYTRIVFNDRRRDSSLTDELVPTKELNDIVTCIFTLAKFWKETIGKYIVTQQT